MKKKKKTRNKTSKSFSDFLFYHQCYSTDVHTMALTLSVPVQSTTFFAITNGTFLSQ